eukprot:gene354-449_t
MIYLQLHAMWKRLSNFTAKHPYLLLTSIFISWILFFDSADLRTQYQLSQKVKKLQEEKYYYVAQIDIIKKEREELISNEELLEKFAREKYFMKRPTEDVYIIE